MTDKPNLADVRRVAEAATEGEWINLPSLDDGVYIVGACDHVGCHDYPMDHPDVLRIKEDEVLYGMSQEDATFIAASRTLIPALLAAVDAVLAECDGEIDVHSRHREQSGLDPDHRPCESASRARFAQRIRAAITAHLDIEPR